jgi:hypothetical protein
VAGEVETKRQLLFVELLSLAPAWHFDIPRAVRPVCVAGIEEVEQADLHGVALGLFGGFHGDADRSQQTRAMPVERIETAGTNQGFDGAPVDQAFVGASTEIEQILERTSRPRAPQDRVHRLFAGSLDGAETVTNRAAVHRREAVFGGIHIRPEDAQAIGEASS